MANTKVTGALIADATITATNIADGAVTAAKLTGITTTSIAEGDKLFYTDARVGTYLSTNGYDTAANIIATITDSAPVTLDTLNELAAALGDDPNYATTTANLIGTKLPLAGGTLTGALSFQDTSIPSAGTARIFSRDTNSYLYLQTGSGNQIQLLDGSQNTMALFNPNLISFSIANSEKLRIDSSGNVLINKTSVNATYLPKLEIQGTSSDGTEGILIGSYLPTLTFYDFSGGATIGQIQQDGTGLVFKNNGSERMRIDSGGNVKIKGTNTKVSWERASDSSPDVVYLTKKEDISSNGNAKLHGYDGIVFSTEGVESEKMRIDSSGNVGIGNSDADAPLEVSTHPTIQYRVQIGNVLGQNQIKSIDSNHSTYRDLNYDAGQHIYRISGSERMRINSSGNVGINTTSPGNIKLKVNQSTNDEWIAAFTSSGTNPYGIYVDTSANSSGGISFATYTNTGTGFFIKNDGKVGIGTNSPIRKLHIDGGSISSDTPTVRISSTDSSGTNKFGIEFYSNNGADIRGKVLADNNGRVYIDDNGGGGVVLQANGGTGHVAIGTNGVQNYTPKTLMIGNGSTDGMITGFSQPSGTGSNSIAGRNLILRGGVGTGAGANGDIIFKGANTLVYGNQLPHAEAERARILSSGGITFNGDTAAANALDDYEEGTWTPSILQQDNLSSTTVSSAKYIKIGNIVHINAEFLTTASSTTAETRLRFTIPFSTNNNGYDDVGHAALIFGSGNNRFGLGSVYRGTSELTSTFVYIAAGQINSATNGSIKVSFTYLIE